MKKIAVLIPCLDEEATIAKVVGDFRAVLPEADVYVCDNNSTDDTSQIAHLAGAHVLKEYRKGKGYAVLRMFSEIDADIYILVDGDDTYPAVDANAMIEQLLRHDASMLVGDRLSNMSYQQENKRKFHNFGNHLIKKLINVFFKSKLQDILSGYRIFTKSFVKNYSSLATGFELETDLTLFALHYDLSIMEYPINYKDRPKGSESKLNTVRDGFRVLLTFFNLYRFYKPFSFFSLIASVLFVSGTLLGTLPVYEFIKFQYVYRVPTAILALGLVTMSLMVFCCGLILDSITTHDKKDTKLKIRNFNQQDNVA